MDLTCVIILLAERHSRLQLSCGSDMFISWFGKEKQEKWVKTQANVSVKVNKSPMTDLSVG